MPTRGPKVFVRPLKGYTDRRVPVKTLVGLYSRHFDEGERVRIADPLPSDRPRDLRRPRLGQIRASRTYAHRTCELPRTEPERDEPPVDTSDIPETPKSFFENATLVAPAMRFSVGETVVLARLPEDPERAGRDSEPFIGRSRRDFRARRGSSTRFAAGGILELFASDDMLDEKSRSETCSAKGERP
jgi:hypothetical protein